MGRKTVSSTAKMLRIAMRTQFIKDIYINFIDFFLPTKGEVDKHGGFVEINYSAYNTDLIEDMESLRGKLLGCDEFMDYINNQEFLKNNDFTDLMVLNPKSVDLIDDNVVGIVKSYLGEHTHLDSALLTVMNMSGIKKTSENQSGFLHHDSVGHRLKLFFPINTNGNSDYPTTYIDKSHKTKWKSYSNDLDAHGVRIPKNIVDTYKFTESPEKLVPFGFGYLFDTNGIHSGVYNQSSEPRMIIQFEFSAKKSFFPGQIGPNQFTMTEYVYNRLKRYNLIRSHRVAMTSKVVFEHKGRARREKTLHLSDFF